MSDKYDRMDSTDLLREMCRKLDRIEAHTGPKVVTVTHEKPRVLSGPWNSGPACSYQREPYGPCVKAEGHKGTHVDANGIGGWDTVA